MKANHNYGNNEVIAVGVGLNISNSKNESKSQQAIGFDVPIERWVKYQ
ncbi:hypothetical protein GO621_09420 [Mucilaginibacter sp. HMF7410]|uniref:Uncharacterized protein n=1 Tax=Mucilaginibacter arboris TaxID=2682090 RepID=A0A7K1SWQ9_9SPHI|nr:hypothetical protein [Mucilaginibacter arboris]MVN21755.1 hypothetical protein [Mucilaginibacter arboris]